MRLPLLVLAVSLAAVGCHAPAAAGRTPLAVPPLGTPGAPGTSRAELERTISEMEARLEAAPDDAGAAVRLADALLRQARVVSHAAPAAKAERVLRSRLSRESSPGKPHRYEMHRLLATALLSQHRFDEAIREAERCLQMQPGDAAPLGIIGDARLELGDRPAAFATFERMARLRPDAASYARVAYARELTGDNDGAIQLMSMALEATSPNDAEALAWHRSQLGALRFAGGRIDDAAREFDHAVHVFPGYPLAVEGQARVAHARGEHRAAVTLLEPVIAGTPSSSTLSLAASVLRALGRSEEARRHEALAAAARVAEGAR
jgi:tetratricopeptide (TPR) repeat protein